MSEKEDFLSRWSRRKQEAVREPKPPRNDEAVEAREPQEQTASEKPRVAPAESAEPLFDLSKLPSLDSIGPGTDIRVFMQPGVPASLSRAALRRAWSADPAIRDFIGLSENSWDFTKPESISGFGPLLPIDDVKRLLSQVLNDQSEPLRTEEIAQRTALQHDNSGSGDDAKMTQASAHEQELGTEISAREPQSKSAPQRTQNDLALQQKSSAQSEISAPGKRRHGSALPS